MAAKSSRSVSRAVFCAGSSFRALLPVGVVREPYTRKRRRRAGTNWMARIYGQGRLVGALVGWAVCGYKKRGSQIEDAQQHGGCVRRVLEAAAWRCWARHCGDAREVCTERGTWRAQHSDEEMMRAECANNAN
jgi:hypothetical protein